MFITAFTLLNAQSDFLGHAVRFTPKTRPERVELDDYRAILLNKYSPLIKNNAYLHEFVEELERYKISYLNSNYEYEDFREADNYLNQLLTRVNLKMALEGSIEVKVVRDPDFNAHAFEDGSIYINIGLLANVDSEAEIAAILSHEIGHIMHQHACKSFLHGKNYIENQESINVFAGGFHSMASARNKKKYFNRIVRQEEEADEFAFGAIKESEFDYGSFKSIFNKFYAVENKYKNSVFYDRSWNYFKTHPNSQQRVKSAGYNSQGSKGRNKFLIDSAFFFKLKQQAIDETINLYFEQLDFNSCLEMSFKQHLLFPTDAFYLFYITECTRRLIASDASYENTLFISGMYNPNFCRNIKDITPTIIYTNGKEKTSDKRVSASIFNKLVGPIVNITPGEYEKITDHPLLIKDTLRFLTNKDAYLYFAGLNRKLNYTFNNYANNKQIYPSAFDSIRETTDRKKYYTYLPTIEHECRENRSDTGKILWILYDFSYFSQASGFFSSEISVNKNASLDKLMTYYDYGEMNLNKRSDLDFDEYNKVKYFFYSVSDKISAYEKNKKAIKKTFFRYSISEVMPEIYSLLRAHNYKAIVFSSVSITATSQDFVGERSTTERWTVNNYWFDARENKIVCYSDIISSSTASAPFMGVNNKKNLEEKYFQSIFNTIAPDKP